MRPSSQLSRLSLVLSWGCGLGKRSNYERIDKDKYLTIDPRAVKALAPFLKPGQRYIEPCAGAGDLIDGLKATGLECVAAFDIEPERDDIVRADALDLGFADRMIITNPPWTRAILHSMIKHFAATARESWLLFDADWMHTKQATRFEPILTDIVSVGRLKWFREDDPRQKGHDPVDNCAWYRFANDKFGATRFWPRSAD